MALTVVGLGNPLAGDDAIGLVLVEAVRGAMPDGVVSLLWPEADALTVAHELLSIEGPVLLVDAARMGLPAGASRLFSADEATLRVKHDPASVHGIGVAEGLALASALGRKAAVHVFGVEPFDVSPGAGLSEAMQRRVPDLTQHLLQAVQRLCTLQE